MAAIPDLFSGYINGREQAIKSNWNDLSNYNSTLGGQMQNAYNMATFDPAVRSAWNTAQQSDYSTIAAAQGLDNTLQANQLAQKAGIPQATANAQAATIQANIDALNKQKEALDLQIQQLQQQLKQQQTAQGVQGAQGTQAAVNPATGNTAPALAPVTPTTPTTK